ncbi:glycosyltransferase [bacterium]|nr:glycosyltransferase [bacterium]
MKVLVLTPYLPHRRVGHGGGTAVRDLVTWLARRHEVMVVALVRPGEEDLLDEVRALGVAVRGLPFLDATARGLARVRLAGRRIASLTRSLSSGYPLYVEKYSPRLLGASLAAAVAEFEPDAIQVEYLQLALLVREMRRRRDADGRAAPRLILNSHELGSVPRERRAARATDPVTRALARDEAARWRRLQVDASNWADATLCVTPEDRALYEAMGGQRLLTVPLGMDLEAIRVDWAPGSRDGRETHLFVGSFGHRPNVLAADFLLDEVWMRVRAARPDAVLVLAGRGSDRYLATRGPVAGVEALGYVDDLTPHFRTARLFLAPLPEGGGIKIKVLEAMARGVPVVTTPVGAEGIATAADDVLTITGCDRSFAAAVLADAADTAACRRRAERARRHMEENFSWESITARLTEIYAAGS